LLPATDFLSPSNQDLHPSLAWLRFREILFHDLQNVRPATPLDDNTLVLHAGTPV
tara:strand:+ start:277 stop:441 length:165 start_codon:yes stop_codon:yes gene_type:complete